ncbi:hypothetical protein C8A05DRAFT_47376 [Staphylotrichum tortipilum]|uniref:C2H2-type domain-containing protein n=1 Tax=Staphylotrichum tortipilum TaxID=2831512 RepID=A0AAN6MDN4_9PEZI|nr:hypothetical protein C8A05DRAFT_47376 [Staphylotrichum longicolle]
MLLAPLPPPFSRPHWLSFASHALPLDRLALERHLAELGLVINVPEPAVICRPCGYALQPTGACVTRHLAEKHAVPKRLRAGLSPFVDSLRLPDPNTLSLRSDWSQGHPHLASHIGVACRHCSYWTTSLDLVTRHLANTHGRRGRNQGRRGRGDWLRDEIFQDVTDGSGGSGLPDLALYTNWMRRTGWLETFDGASRDVLVRLTLPPGSIERGGDSLRLSAPGSKTRIWSSRKDKDRLGWIASALHGLQARCEDTARHTDLVGRQTIARAYWRLFLRFLCFSFRLWRLLEATRASLCRRSLTWDQHLALQAAWLALGDPPPRDEQQMEPGSCSGSESEDSGYDDSPSSEPITTTTAKDIPVSIRSSSTSVPRQGGTIDEDLGILGVSDDEDTDKDNSTSNDEGGYDDNDDNDDNDNNDTEFAVGEEEAAATSDQYYQDILLQLAKSLVTEPFRDGMSTDGSTFERPSRYTPKLSALIYYARLILLETTLPRRSHDHIQIPTRPRQGQLERLNKVRAKAFCLGSQAPVGELLSLRNYGRKLARADGPAFHVRWSDDGQVLSWDNGSLSISQFRALSHSLLESVSSSTRCLMMSMTAKGYSFVVELANHLADAFLALSELQLLTLIHLTGGQAARAMELLYLEHCNGVSTSRGIYVYGGSFFLVTRHTKARTMTNNEFQVARVLPDAVGRILYQYLRCYGIDLDSLLLFCSSTRVYRQLSITITEKHVQ